MHLPLTVTNACASQNTLKTIDNFERFLNSACDGCTTFADLELSMKNLSFRSDFQPANLLQVLITVAAELRLTVKHICNADALQVEATAQALRCAKILCQAEVIAASKFAAVAARVQQIKVIKDYTTKAALHQRAQATTSQLIFCQAAAPDASMNNKQQVVSCCKAFKYHITASPSLSWSCPASLCHFSS